MKYIDILSLFPAYFESPFNVSIIKRAIENRLININHVDIRDFSEDKHRRVDDRPFGGGPGMVLSPNPLCKAIRSVKRENSHVVYLSPQGKMLDNKKLKQLSEKEHLILVSGHYEGIDQRVIEKEIDEEISIGDYVLTNGSIASIVLIDGMVRYIPGVLGHPESSKNDSFEDSLFDAPHYTRPVEFEDMTVPEILRSGHEKKINEWRYEKRANKTKSVRPDLYQKHKELLNKN
jgi:tRNA (guanine37-N1)-methyltransferase